MLIDSHQHFWRLQDREGQWPPSELSAIHRDFLPSALTPLLRESNVDGTVVVQSLPSIRDTKYLLDLASRNEFILGVVGWVDLESRDAASSIAELAKSPKLKGLRPMLQGMADLDWMEHPGLASAIHEMLEREMCFDALVLPHQLKSLVRFAKLYPELSITINHAAKPLIGQAGMEPWLSDMRALAMLPQVNCKLSGLLTEVPQGMSVESINPYVQAILETFGAERLLWGSDWPVLRLASDYCHWLAMCKSMLKHLSEQQQAAVFGLNAIRVYRLEV